LFRFTDLEHFCVIVILRLLVVFLNPESRGCLRPNSGLFVIEKMIIAL